MAGQILSADPSLEGVDVDLLTFPRKLFWFRHLMSRGADRETLFIPCQINETSPGFLEALVLARDFECMNLETIFSPYGISLRTRIGWTSGQTIASPAKWYMQSLLRLGLHNTVHWTCLVLSRPLSKVVLFTKKHPHGARTGIFLPQTVV